MRPPAWAPGSRMLTRPLYLHLAEVAGEPGMEEIRLWAGGDADSWEVEEFPLYTDILRWVDANRFVCLLVTPTALTCLNEGSRIALASLVAAGRGGIKVHIAPAPAVDVVSGTMIAAIGGVDRHVAWAMPGRSVAPMNHAWGQPSEDGPVVYTQSEGALLQLETEALTVDALRPQPNGTAVLPVGTELNGRIKGFGSRFWNHIRGHCRPLKDQFERGGALKRVRYCDRYLTTPWPLLLLREVLLHLVREGYSDSGTALHLFTRSIRPDYRPHQVSRSISDRWQDDTARRSFFEQAIDIGRDHLRWQGPFRFDTGNAPHFRELRLEWRSGDIWTVKLDQGFGHWQHRPYANFPFDKNPREQVRFMNATAKNLKVVTRGSHATFVYVAKELKCEE